MNTDIRIRDLEPKDAFELSALFSRCYGDTYSAHIFYDVAALSALISNLKLVSVVAIRHQRIVGHVGITVRHEESDVCEAGNTVVDPSSRGQGLLMRLGVALNDLVRRKGYVAYLHYPTTAHAIMQQASVAYGGKETGLMVAYVPETMDAKIGEKQAGRIAATVAYQPLTAPSMREVILPERYHDVIADIYAKLEFDRRITKAQNIKVQNGRKQGLVSGEADLIENFNPQQELLHIFVAAEGRRIRSKVSALIRRYQPKVTHVDLPLDSSDIAFVIEDLRELGFFFCALLPGFAHTDLIRLQAISSLKPSDLELKLVNQDAISLASFIRHDAAQKLELKIV